MKIKSKLKKVSVGLLVSAIAISGAYAWLKNSDTATRKNNISVGSTEIIFANQQRVINLADNSVIPMTKEYAIENLTAYTFDIQNKGSIDLDFMISVDGDSYSNTFADGKINVLLAPIADGASEEDIKTALRNATLLKLDAYADLTQATLTAGNSKHYALLAFVDKNTTLEEYEGKSVSFKLRVDAVQHASIIEDFYATLNKSQIATTITAGGENKNVEVYNIEGDDKTSLLDKLDNSGLANSSEVAAIVEVKGEDYDGLNSTATFDVSSIASTGDKVVISHFNESTNEWEYIGTETVADDGTISEDFTSYSPVVFIAIKPNGSLVEKTYDENGNLIQTKEYTTFGDVITTDYDESGEITNKVTSSNPATNPSYELTTNMYYYEETQIESRWLEPGERYDTFPSENQSEFKLYTGTVYKYYSPERNGLYEFAQAPGLVIYHIEFEDGMSTDNFEDETLLDTGILVSDLIVGENYTVFGETKKLVAKFQLDEAGPVEERAYRYERTYSEYPMLKNEYSKLGEENVREGTFVLYEGDIYKFEQETVGDAGDPEIVFAAVSEIYEKIYTNELGEKFICLDGNAGTIGSDETIIMNDKGVGQIFVLESQHLITGTQVR